MQTETDYFLKCRSCGNTETFKRSYHAAITETVVISKLGWVTDSDMDIDENPYDDDEDTYVCVHCLSDDIDTSRAEGLHW